MQTKAPGPARLSQLWLLFAVTSLGIGAVAAIFLVVARTPWMTSWVTMEVFRRALVVHVNFATLIWYFAMAGALWSEQLPATGVRMRVAQLALLGAVTGALGVLASGIVSSAPPILANYIPYLDHPGFLASLALFGASTGLVALISLKTPADAADWGFTLARAPFLLGLLYFIGGHTTGLALPDSLWGTGHILQYGFITLMMAIWLRLSARSDLKLPSHRLCLALLGAAVAPSLVAPAALVLQLVPADQLHSLHTDLMRWSNWPAALALGLLLVLRNRHKGWRTWPLSTSVGLLTAGILAGTAIDRQTTLIPAHYHGTIGAFTLALMTAASVRAGAYLAPRTRDARPLVPLGAYGLGITLLIAGLAWSGLLGAPRKSGFAGGAGAELGDIIAAILTGLGGTITIAGVCYFVIVTAPRIVCLIKASEPTPCRHQKIAHAPTFAGAR